MSTNHLVRYSSWDSKGISIADAFFLCVYVYMTVIAVPKLIYLVLIK